MVGNLPAPLYEEPPGIIQWLYEYLSGNEVRRLVNAFIFRFVFCLFCLFVFFGEGEAGVTKKTSTKGDRVRS